MTTQEIGTGELRRTHRPCKLTISAYAAATATSVLIAVGLTRAVPHLPLSRTAKELLGKLVPFVSVASAGVVK